MAGVCLMWADIPGSRPSAAGVLASGRVVTHALRTRFRGPQAVFHSEEYVRHNQRRQEHLATLGLPLSQRTVLEVGAGIGDHSSFFLDRGCEITVTDGRSTNVEVLQRRYGTQRARLLDLDAPDPGLHARFEVVYCYGTLYHLSRPDAAIAYLGSRCTGLMLVETCVSFGERDALHPEPEATWCASQAVASGCRPTRPWVWNRLSEHFAHVYVTTTQPWHEEFPLDWSSNAPAERLTRAVFVASRTPLDLPTLSPRLVPRQSRT